MTRELKEGLTPQRLARIFSCSPNPYDKGTESQSIVDEAESYDGCSPNPYDKGTESLYKLGDHPNMAKRYSPNPYDKGTESLTSPAMLV